MCESILMCVSHALVSIMTCSPRIICSRRRKRRVQNMVTILTGCDLLRVKKRMTVRVAVCMAGT